jgi:hypothetical protein
MEAWEASVSVSSADLHLDRILLNPSLACVLVVTYIAAVDLNGHISWLYAQATQHPRRRFYRFDRAGRLAAVVALQAQQSGLYERGVRILALA